MAGQEIEGDLWDQSLGLDLLPTIVCAGFQVQDPVPRLCAKFGEQRATFNEISSQSSITLTQVDPCIEKDVLRKI
jgi:hypothetical protein